MMPLVLLANGALAGSEQIIKQRAKDLRDQNNARQGVPSSRPVPATPAQPQPVYVPSTPQTATPQQQRASRLQSSLAPFTPSAQSSAQGRQQLARDLISVAATTKPSSAVAGKAADALAAALHERLLSTATRKRLVQNLEGILNPGSAADFKVNAFIADISALFTSNGVSKEKIATLDSALKALAAETRKKP
jgi:hypothetical protein